MLLAYDDDELYYDADEQNENFSGEVHSNYLSGSLQWLRLRERLLERLTKKSY